MEQQYLEFYLANKDKFPLKVLAPTIGLSLGELVVFIKKHKLAKVPVKGNNDLLLNGPVYDETELTSYEVLKKWWLSAKGTYHRFKFERYLRELGGVCYKGNWLKIHYEPSPNDYIDQRLVYGRQQGIFIKDLMLGLPHVDPQYLLNYLVTARGCTLRSGIIDGVKLRQKSDVSKLLEKARKARATYSEKEKIGGKKRIRS